MTNRLKNKKIKGGAAARRERCDLLLWKTLHQRKSFDLKNNQASEVLLFVLKFMAAPITVMFVLLLIKELR
jgi:hypothetical protein